MRRDILILIGVATLLVGCGANGSGTNSTPSSSAPVVISTDRATYTPGDAIVAMVHNPLSTPIYAMDTQSSCSILALQFQANSTWQASQVAQCPLKRPARPVKIDAGGTYMATITAGYPGLKQLPVPVGSYRLVLVYTTSPSGIPSTGDSATITSTVIQVQ